MHINDARFSRVIKIPDGIQQLFPAQDAIDTLRHVKQQFEFFRRHFNQFSRYMNLIQLRENGDFAHFDFFCCVLRLFLLGSRNRFGRNSLVRPS
ncbi:hypothetical protein SDC9_104540 [bioreactor metagenome]|uniref:Uncharacterized protein n=1 Tax=bioreactor metagenome TaxID=1076179 RepID=A0A645AX44_9ZZZZ